MSESPMEAARTERYEMAHYGRLIRLNEMSESIDHHAEKDLRHIRVMEAFFKDSGSFPDPTIMKCLADVDRDLEALISDLEELEHQSMMHAIDVENALLGTEEVLTAPGGQ